MTAANRREGGRPSPHRRGGGGGLTANQWEGGRQACRLRPRAQWDGARPRHRRPRGHRLRRAEPPGHRRGLRRDGRRRRGLDEDERHPCVISYETTKGVETDKGPCILKSRWTGAHTIDETHTNSTLPHTPLEHERNMQKAEIIMGCGRVWRVRVRVGRLARPRVVSGRHSGVWSSGLKK